MTREPATSQPYAIVGIAEIAQRANTTPGTVRSWRARHADFPKPDADLAMGPAWYWGSVDAWLRRQRPNGRPPRGAKAVVAVLAAVVAIGLAGQSRPVLAADEPAVIVQTAYSVLGARYRAGADGPNRFDCSGFVWYVFETAGFADRIGGARLRAREYQRAFRRAGLTYTDKRQAKVGDLVFFGRPAVHVAIVTRIVHPRRHPRRIRLFVTGATTDLGIVEVRLDRLRTSRPLSEFATVDLQNVPDPTPTPPTEPPTPEPSPTVEPTPSPTEESTAEPTVSPSAEPSPSETPVG